MSDPRYMVVSYAPKAGMGDLDAPLGWIFEPYNGANRDTAGIRLDWMTGGYARDKVATYAVREIAETIARNTPPHVAGGRVAVIPAA
jgi:hypothetical protein